MHVMIKLQSHRENGSGGGGPRGCIRFARIAHDLRYVCRIDEQGRALAPDLNENPAGISIA
jgi:hypothetical protein